jgi:hypothetical protein
MPFFRAVRGLRPGENIMASRRNLRGYFVVITRRGTTFATAEKE